VCPGAMWGGLAARGRLVAGPALLEPTVTSTPDFVRAAAASLPYSPDLGVETALILVVVGECAVNLRQLVPPIPGFSRPYTLAGDPDFAMASTLSSKSNPLVRAL
jgi:hypothetical protein